MNTLRNHEPKTDTRPRPLIVLAEDDEVFRDLVAENLERAGFEVRQAENGLVAKTIFDLNVDHVAAIITDIQMPELDGLALLKEVRDYSLVPVIMMTGFGDILEAKAAHDFGANGFLLKPFRTDLLLSTLNSCLSPAPSAPTPNPEPPAEAPSFCEIHIDEFISTSRLISDVYIRLSDEKFIKVARAGDKVPVERLRTYKHKNVEYLYVKVEDFGRYVDFNRLIASAAVKMPLAEEKKVMILKVTTESLVHQCFLAGIDQGSIRAAQSVVEQTLATIGSDGHIIDAFVHLHTHSDKLYANSVACSVLACMVARRHGWTSPSTLFILTLAGLFQDIGLKEVEPAILKKSRILRSLDETKLIESHPSRSRDIVLQLRGVPEQVSQIVLQHLETLSGNGYPLRPRRDELNALSRLLITVNVFVSLISPLEEDLEPLEPKEALVRMVRVHRNDIDLMFARRLMELFTPDEEPELKKLFDEPHS